MNTDIVSKIRKGYYITLSPENNNYINCPNCDVEYHINCGYNNCPACGERIKDVIDEEVSYNEKAKELYYTRKQQLHDEFKNTILVDIGLDSHPRKDEIFNYIYDKYHSDGYESVYNELSNISHLFIE